MLRQRWQSAMRSTTNAFSSITQEQVSVNPGESQTHQFQLRLWCQQCRLFEVRSCSKMFEAIALPQSSTIASRRFAAIALNTCADCAQWVRFRCCWKMLEAMKRCKPDFWHHVQDVPIFFETKPTEWSLQPRTPPCSNYQSHPATRWGLLWPSIHRELRMEEWRLTGTRGPRLGNPKV